MFSSAPVSIIAGMKSTFRITLIVNTLLHVGPQVERVTGLNFATHCRLGAAACGKVPNFTTPVARRPIILCLCAGITFLGGGTVLLVSYSLLGGGGVLSRERAAGFVSCWPCQAGIIVCLSL